MDITLYNTSKKTNSTKVPNGGVTLNSVTLKNGCDILKPVFMLSSDDNYFKDTITEIGFQGKYYFVTDIKSVRNNLWEISCEIDVLATYKAEIISNKFLVEFDETTNTTIVDSRLPIKSTVSRAGNIVSMRDIMREGGTYLLGVTGKGSVDTFAFTDIATINAILDSVNDWADGLYASLDPSDIPGIVDSIVITGKQMVTQGNAINNIRSCIWIPWSITNGVTVKDVTLGNYETGYTGYSITKRTSDHVYSVKIPWNFSDWRNKSPYTTIYLYIPFVGYIHYSSDELIGIDSLTIQFSIDRVTGAISAVVKSGEYIIGTYGGNSGIVIPIGSSNINASQTVGSIVGAGTALVMGNWLGGASLVSSALTSMVTPLSTTIGSFGNGSGATQPEAIACYVYTHDIPDAPNSYAPIIGTPTYRVKELSALTGFVKTGNASVSVNGATFTEINMINDLLNGGVYIE